MIEYTHAYDGRLVSVLPNGKWLNDFYKSQANGLLETSFQMENTETGGLFFSREFCKKNTPEELKNGKAIYFATTGLIIRGGTEEELKNNPLKIELPTQVSKAVLFEQLKEAGIEIRHPND